MNFTNLEVYPFSKETIKLYREGKCFFSVTLLVNFYRRKDTVQFRSLNRRILVVVPQNSISFLYKYIPMYIAQTFLKGGGIGYLSTQGTAMHLPYLSLPTATDIFMLSYSHVRMSTCLRYRELWLPAPDELSQSCQFHLSDERPNIHNRSAF